MKIYFGSDHAGFRLKNILVEYVTLLGHEVEDLGALSLDEADDYPDYVKKVAQEVGKNPQTTKGIVIGGSGQGEAMVANRFKNIRCTLFYGPVEAKGEVDVEGQFSIDPFIMLKLSRAHNNANMLSLGARFMTKEEAKEAVSLWISSPFNNEERHVRRINKFN